MQNGALMDYPIEILHIAYVYFYNIDLIREKPFPAIDAVNNVTTWHFNIESEAVNVSKYDCLHVLPRFWC